MTNFKRLVYKTLLLYRGEGEGEGRGRGRGCTNSCRISISWHNLARTRNDKTHDKTLSFFCLFF